MHLDQLLLALLVLLAVSAVSIALFTRLGLGSIFGLLAAGFVVGPSGLAITRRVTELRHVSELGIVLLLFIGVHE
jgi:glutathione-regulated potassium-efflux system ancillary protein KefC